MLIVRNTSFGPFLIAVVVAIVNIMMLAKSG